MSAPQEGQIAPDFTLRNAAGTPVRLSDFRGKKFVVLYFYPKDLTPGCTQEACDFSANLSDFSKKDTVVLGVSPDDEALHQKFITTYQLKHELLSDPDKKVAELYGVYREKNNYGKKVLGIVRSTFVIDKAGKILKLFSNVKVDGHWEKVLKAILE